jgi:hypothetical protein
MGKYAAKTAVSAEKSRSEIERTLQRYGATHFMYGWKGDAAVIAFQMSGKAIKFILPLPDVEEFKKPYQAGRTRTELQARSAWEQASRQRWRALSLCIKAKLEAVESGITSFEQEFLAHVVMPSGETFGEYAIPKLDEAQREGRLPQLAIGM